MQCGRRARAEPRGHAHRLAAFADADVEHREVVEDRELHGLAGEVGERVDLLLRLAHHVHLAAHERAELEEREAEAVLPVLAVLLEDVVLDQRRREAVHRALGEAEPRRRAR